MNSRDTGAHVVDKRRNWETRVEMMIFKRPSNELSTYDKLVYAILCGHANRDGNAMLYVRTIAEEASCSERQAQRALSNLETRGLLIRKPQTHNGRQTFNVYEVYGFSEYNSLESSAKPASKLDAERVLASGNPGVQDSHPCRSDTPAPPHSHPWGDCEAGLNNVFKQLLKNIKENTPPTPPGGKEEGGKIPEEQKQHGTEQKAKGTEASGAEFFELVLNAYNTALPELPQTEKVTASRAKIIKQRIEEDVERRKLSWWKHFFLRVRGFPWPMGDNPSKWRADFDWLIGEKGMQKILEGGFGRASSPILGKGTKAGWELQKKYTDEGGRINGRAILREIQSSQARG